MVAPTIGAIGARLTGTETTTAQVAVPPGVVVDSVVVVTICRNSFAASYDPLTSVAAGFTLVDDNPGRASHNSGVTTVMDVLWKRATGADSGTYDFGWTDSAYRVAFAARIDGCRTTDDPFEADDGAAQAGTAPTTDTPALSVTTIGTDRLLLWAATSWDSGTWTMPTGFTQQVSDVSFDLLTCGTKNQAVAGGSGSLVGSQPGSSAHAAWVGAFVGEGGTSPGGGAQPVTLVAADGELISGSTQSNFLGNGYYTRKGFTRATDWSGPNPLGGSFAGWDDPTFIPIGTFLTDFAGTEFYSRMDDLGLNSMLPCAGSVSLTNNVTYGKGAVVTIESHAAGTISSGDDPGVVGVSSGEEPSDVAGYNIDNADRATWLASADGPGRFGFYNFREHVLNGELGGTVFPPDMMTSADFVTCDMYFFSSAADNSGSTLNKMHNNLYQYLPGTATESECARGSHYGSMLDSMRKNLDSATTRPFLSWIENGAPSDLATSVAITPAQLKWAVWATFVHGARGIAYFNHTFRSGDPLVSFNNFNNDGYGGPGVAGTGIYAAAKEVNLRALQIAPVINAPRDGYFVYGDMAASGSIANAGFLTAVTSTNARAPYAGVDACCKWVPTTEKHWILSTTREQDGTTNWPVTFRMVDQGQTAAHPMFGGSDIAITRGGAIPAGFCEFSDTFATAADYKCYRID
jgi:hypothetical protein